VKEDATKLAIKKDPSGTVYVQNIVIKESRTLKEMETLLDLGIKTRHIASTDINVHSS